MHTARYNNVSGGYAQKQKTHASIFNFGSETVLVRTGELKCTTFYCMQALSICAPLSEKQFRVLPKNTPILFIQRQCRI